MELAGELNRLAGNPRSEYRGIAAAANQWAGTTDLELVGALNTKAGIPRAEWLDLRGVLRRLGFTEGGTADSPTGAAGVGQLQNTLRLPGIAGNYLSTPDTAAASITGDIDIRVRVALDDWNRVGQYFVYKRGANNGYGLRTHSATPGRIEYIWGDGTTNNFRTSSASAPFAAGSVGWVRVTHDVDNGAANNDVKFFTSDDGVTWTQLGTTATSGGVTAIADTTQIMLVGGDAGSAMVGGHVYYAEVRSGIDGNVVAKFDSSTVAVRGDRTPTTHTQPSAAEAIRLPGVAGNYLSIPDSPANSVTGDIDIRAKLSMDDWTPGAATAIVSKYGGVGNRSYLLWMGAANFLELYLSADGTTGTAVSAGVGLPGATFVDGSAGFVRATYRKSDRRVQFFWSTDGTSWTQVGTDKTHAQTGIADTTQPLWIGTWNTGTSEMLAGNIYEAQVRNGIDGNIVANFNAANTVPTDMRTPATTSDGWTINGNGWSWDAPAGAPSSGAVRLPGTSGNYISTPDAADISITGDIDLRCKVTLDDWTPAVNNTAIGKRGATTSYQLRINTAGTLNLLWSADGTTVLNINSTVATGLADGETKWIRATLDVDNGAVGNDVKFYTSADGVTWVQLGTTVTTSLTTSIFDNAETLGVGGRSDGAEILAGYIHRAEVRNGIDGAIVASFDAANAPITGTRTPTTVVQSGRTWTLNGTAWAWVDVPDPTEWTVNGADWWWGTYTGTQRYTQAIELDEQYVYFPGTSGNYASTPDSAALSITGDIDIRAKVALDDWSPAADQTFVAKRASNTDWSYQLGIDNVGKITFSTTSDGTTGTLRDQRSNVAVTFADGSINWVRVTRVAATGVTQFFTSSDGVTWTQLGTNQTATTGAIFDGVAAVEIGSNRGGGANLLAGKVYYAEIRNGIGGTVVGRFSPYNANVGAVRSPTTFGGFGSTEVWTINGSAWQYGVFAAPLISTPDSAALSITGDIDLRVKLTANQWGEVAGQTLLDKRTTGGYTLRLSGTPFELIWNDGTTSFFRSPNVALPFSPGQTGWLRATLDVDNGAAGHTATFYTSTDGVTWTQLGSPAVTALPTSIGDSTSPLTIGAAPSGSGRFNGGTIHYAEIRSGIGGTVVGVFNPGILKSPYDQTPTTLKSPTGETYTITGSGWRWRTSEV